MQCNEKFKELISTPQISGKSTHAKNMPTSVLFRTTFVSAIRGNDRIKVWPFQFLWKREEHARGWKSMGVGVSNTGSDKFPWWLNQRAVDYSREHGCGDEWCKMRAICKGCKRNEGDQSNYIGDIWEVLSICDTWVLKIWWESRIIAIFGDQLDNKAPPRHDRQFQICLICKETQIFISDWVIWSSLQSNNTM